VRQGAGKPTFANTSWSNEQDVLILTHPFTGGKRAQQLAIQAPWMLIIDIFDHSALFQPGRLKTSCQRAIFLPEPLLIDQHREAFLEAELTGIGGFHLRTESIGHSVQFHRM
jgi:hypothetical protein